jgi:hypothetical protein
MRRAASHESALLRIDSLRQSTTTMRVRSVATRQQCATGRAQP